MGLLSNIFNGQVKPSFFITIKDKFSIVRMRGIECYYVVDENDVIYEFNWEHVKDVYKWKHLEIGKTYELPEIRKLDVQT
jgi:hypothetical protein